MNDTTPTLDTFFQYSQIAEHDSRKLQALESTRSMALVREKVKQAASGNSMPVTAAQLHAPISHLLKGSLLDVIVRGWNENRLFEKFLDPQLYDPEESVLLSLKKHSVTSSHKPHIDIILNGTKLGQIDFTIDLSLTLEGIILELQGGTLVEISTGNVTGHGTLKCEDLVLLKRETGVITFPGRIRISDSNPSLQQ